MALVTEEFQHMVLDDLAAIDGLYHPVKASLLERALVRKVKIGRLHPNPDDEFCHLDVGPSYSIISDYEEIIRQNLSMDIHPLPERIVVGKISTGDYMILNGHHRWFACHRLGLKKIPIEIVNIISDEEIVSKINALSHDRMVSFDLDESLLVDKCYAPHIRRSLSLSSSYLNRKTLRKNAAALIDELHKQGFDIWVYTAGYAAEKYINAVFKVHNSYVDGIINGMKNRNRKSSTSKVFAQKYTTAVHIDIENVTWTSSTSCQRVPIEAAGDDWAAKVISIIRNLDEQIS